VSKYSGLDTLLLKVENAFNAYLEAHNGNFYTTTFIIEMNQFLSELPHEIVKHYYWNRPSYQQKPSLHLITINKIVKFLTQEKKYKVIQPCNLDTFLI